MKKSLFFALLIPLVVAAQQQPDLSKQGTKPPLKKDDELQTPVPIIRSMVNAIVAESQAQIMSPQDTDSLKTTAAAARLANVSEYPRGFIAKPVSRVFDLDVDSSEAPRLVRLSSGSITSLVFTDNFGNPWLIKSRSIDCQQFNDNVCESKGQGSTQAAPTNILKVSPKTPYAYGNVVVELEDLPSPIIFMIAAGQSDETDIRIEARVAGKNPGAKPQVMLVEKVLDSDSSMGAFLDGVPPTGARKLKATGGKAEIWSLNGFFYVRTRMTLLNPSFLNHSANADGLHVYKYEQTPSIFGSIDGRTTTLSISGY